MPIDKEMAAINSINELQQNVEKIDKELKRSQLEKVIPMDSIRFKNENGEFDSEKYAAEIEKRVNGNMTVEDVQELWDNRTKVDNYNMQRNANSNRRPKTASFSTLYNNVQRTNVHVHNYEPSDINRPQNVRSNTWFIDMSIIPIHNSNNKVK